MGHRSRNFCGIPSTRAAVPRKSRYSKASFQLAVEDKPSKPSILFTGGSSLQASGACLATHAPPTSFRAAEIPLAVPRFTVYSMALISRFAVVPFIMREAAMHSRFETPSEFSLKRIATGEHETPPLPTAWKNWETWSADMVMWLSPIDNAEPHAWSLRSSKDASAVCTLSRIFHSGSTSAHNDGPLRLKPNRRRSSSTAGLQRLCEEPTPSGFPPSHCHPLVFPGH